MPHLFLKIMKSEYPWVCKTWGFLSQLKDHELIDKRIKRYNTVFWPLTERKDWWIFFFNVNKTLNCFFSQFLQKFISYLWSKVKSEHEYFSIFFGKKIWSFPSANAFENFFFFAKVWTELITLAFSKPERRQMWWPWAYFVSYVFLENLFWYDIENIRKKFSLPIRVSVRFSSSIFKSTCFLQEN